MWYIRPSPKSAIASKKPNLVIGKNTKTFFLLRPSSNYSLCFVSIWRKIQRKKSDTIFKQNCFFFSYSFDKESIFIGRAGGCQKEGIFYKMLIKNFPSNQLLTTETVSTYF